MEMKNREMCKGKWFKDYNWKILVKENKKEESRKEIPATSQRHQSSHHQRWINSFCAFSS